jgi:uncharacterized protein (TIGR02996 family)
MPTDEDGFLNAIRDNPADEAARLVYADWLAERDDPRAAFARLSGEFLRCVRGLADLRRALPTEWLEVMDPLFNRFSIFSLPLLGADVHEARVGNVLVEPGSAVTAGQILLTVQTTMAWFDLPSVQPGIITSVFVRPGESVTLHQPLLAYLSGLEKFALRTPRGPLLSFIHSLDDHRASLRRNSRDLNEAMLARHTTALTILFGAKALSEAWRAAEHRRGWDTGIHSLDTLMTRAGLTAEQKIQERIDVHIETLRELLARHGQPDEFRELPELPGEAPGEDAG